jgi:hypothetical protein
LAGTGKSTLISEFTRALPAQQDIDLGPFVVGGVIPSKSYLRVRVDAGTNLADLLNPWLQPEPSHGKEKMSELGPSVVRKSKPRASIATLVPAAARYSYRIGLTASLVDEMQFLTQGASANAQVTKFLLMMSYIGVPLIYAANYSLCNKLLNRHQEDRDRLVSDVIVLSPMKQTDDELGRILKAYDQILGDCVKGSLCEFLEDYGAMTLGIKRKVKELTLAAFEEMRRTKELTISRKHIRTAFQKRVSAVSQNDIQLILAQSNSGKPARGRSDLWCPFGEEFNVFTLPARAQSVKHEQAIGQTLLRDSLTATEKALLNSTQKLDQATTSSIARDVKSRDRSSSSKRESISAEDLLANTISYQKNPSTQRKRQ